MAVLFLRVIYRLISVPVNALKDKAILLLRLH
jgi:hypothetical protein